MSVSQDVEFPLPDEAPAADPLRVYLGEIGKIALLTAQQEVELARRIEAGQIELRRALADVPMAVAALGKIGERAGGGEATARDALESPLWGVLIERLATDVRTAAERLEGPELEAALGLPSGQLVPLLARIEAHHAAVRQAKREFTEANLRLVVSVAKHYARSGVPLLDLIQDGNLGLMRAVDGFQYRRGFKFSTYATWWIRQAITRAVADRGRTIRLPLHLAETLHKVSRAARVMANELGREPTPEELARRTRVGPARIRLVLDAAPRPLSLETPVGDEARLADFLEDASADSPATSAFKQDLSIQVERALSNLAPRERDVIRLRFGIGDEPARTLEEIGARFNLTRERIRQIELIALRKLRLAPTGRSLRAFTEN